jgi:hypothetical protein
MNSLEEKRERQLETFVFGLAAGTLAVVLFRAIRLVVVGGWLGTTGPRSDKNRGR